MEKVKSFGWPEAIVLIAISMLVIYVHQSGKPAEQKKPRNHVSVRTCVTKYLDQEDPANIITLWTTHGSKEIQQDPYHAEEVGQFRVENSNLMLEGDHEYKAVITENERGQRTMWIKIYADHFRRYRGNPMDLYAQQSDFSITCTENELL